MAEILAPAFPHVVISTPGTFKTSDPAEVHGIFRAMNPGAVLERDPAAALAAARRAAGAAGSRLPILVTGSFYMVAEIRRLVMKEENHGP